MFDLLALAALCLPPETPTPHLPWLRPALLDVSLALDARYPQSAGWLLKSPERWQDELDELRWAVREAYEAPPLWYCDHLPDLEACTFRLARARACQAQAKAWVPLAPAADAERLAASARHFERAGDFYSHAQQARDEGNCRASRREHLAHARAVLGSGAFYRHEWPEYLWSKP